MQEEVTQKTIALYVKVGKGAARLTEQALQKAIQKFLEQKSKPAHGKQTMRQLMKQNAGVSNIEITDSCINDIMKTIHYPHEMVLIAIGYLLREDSIYFNEQYMIIEYKTFYF